MPRPSGGGADAATMYPAFFSGRCDAMTQDTGALAGALVAAPNPRDDVLMEERISKEPLGPFTRSGDEAWSDIIMGSGHAADLHTDCDGRPRSRDA